MRKPIAAAMLLAAALAPMSAHAQEAEISANAGWVSQYYYRGIFQKTSSASAGLDLAIGGLGLGTWAADVGDGAEVDLFASYGFSAGDFGLSVGGTGYFYTGEYDDTYLEGNLGVGYGPLALAFAVGQYDTEPDAVSYWFGSATVTNDSGCFATFGIFGGDDEFYAQEGKYVEAGYGWSAADMDFSISGIWSDENISGALDEDGDATHELTFVFGVSKAFSLR